jgi:hypothetical protein
MEPVFRLFALPCDVFTLAACGSNVSNKKESNGEDDGSEVTSEKRRHQGQVATHFCVDQIRRQRRRQCKGNAFDVPDADRCIYDRAAPRTGTQARSFYLC